MPKKYLISLCLVIVNFIFVSSVSAWDDTGHKVTAYIAWRQMTPEVRAETVKLLLAAPEDSHLSVYYPAGSRSRESKELELFMVASTWSDIIRDRDFKARYEKYHQGPWHYADIFWKQIGGKAEIMENRSEGLAIVKLYDFEKNLKDDSVSDAEKAINLAWFLHVGGDVHNPVHNASRITEIEPKGDQGGNLFLLSPANSQGGDRVNLHSYWDSILRRNMARENDACDSEYIASIAKKITKRHPYSQMKNRLKLGDFKEWNNEGFNLLNQVVYSDTLKRGELPSKKYQNRAFANGQEQIALAGYRLGEMLNRIFGKS
ncbi:MAG TPA: S1/P1 nuclease [Pyrinomonadaceae bacterium]|nr:S1/P1 nuclease [Pyrinomonadaceae bacterium]